MATNKSSAKKVRTSARKRRAKPPSRKVHAKAKRRGKSGKLPKPVSSARQEMNRAERERALPNAIKLVQAGVINGKPFDASVKTAAREFGLNPKLVDRKFHEQHGSVEQVLERKRFLDHTAIKMAAWRAEQAREMEPAQELSPAARRALHSRNWEKEFEAWEKEWERNWKKANKSYERRLAALKEALTTVMVNDYKTDRGEPVKGAPFSVIEKHLEAIDLPALDALFSYRDLIKQLMDAGFRHLPVRKKDLKFMAVAL